MTRVLFVGCVFLLFQWLFSVYAACASVFFKPDLYTYCAVINKLKTEIILGPVVGAKSSHFGPDTQGRFLVVPEDVAMLFTTIYGFAPPIHKGNDHRIGFGYRFGNHADIQVLYEFGPQTTTKELQSINVRSLPLSDRKTRRPLLDLLTRTGLVKDASQNDNVVQDEPK